jgi:hypothetical protein
MAASAVTLATPSSFLLLTEREEITIATTWKDNTAALFHRFQRTPQKPGTILATAIVGTTIRTIEITVTDKDAIPRWLEPSLDRAIRLMLLAPNWDMGGGRPIQRASINAALQFLSTVMQERSSLPQWLPTSEGGVQLEWHEANLDLEIQFSADGASGHVVFGDLLDERLEWHGPLSDNLERLKPHFENRLVRIG